MPETQAPDTAAALSEAVAAEFLRVSRRQLRERAYRIEFRAGRLWPPGQTTPTQTQAVCDKLIGT